MGKHSRIIITPDCYITLAVGVLLLPAKWLIAWVFAVVAHEASHCTAMLILRVPINSISISVGGAQMHTGYMSPWTEFICTLAGPAGALSLMAFSRYIPCTAVCVMIQSLFNLLPVYPYDGGRLLFCFLERICRIKCSKKILSFVRYVTLAGITGCAAWVSWRLNLGIFPVLLCVLILVRTNMIKSPCKVPAVYSTIRRK